MSDIVRVTRKRQYDPDASGGLGAVVTLDGVSPSIVDLFPQDVLEGVHIAATDLEAGTPVYKKISDNKWYKSDATDSSAESDSIHGWTLSRTPSGQNAAIAVGSITLGYSDGTAPKAKPVYLSSNAGNIADAPAYAGQLPCGYSFDGYNVRVWGFVFQPDVTG